MQAVCKMWSKYACLHDNDDDEQQYLVGTHVGKMWSKYACPASLMEERRARKKAWTVSCDWELSQFFSSIQFSTAAQRTELHVKSSHRQPGCIFNWVTWNNLWSASVTFLNFLKLRSSPNQDCQNKAGSIHLNSFWTGRSSPAALQEDHPCSVNGWLSTAAAVYSAICVPPPLICWDIFLTQCPWLNILVSGWLPRFVYTSMSENLAGVWVAKITGGSLQTLKIISSDSGGRNQFAQETLFSKTGRLARRISYLFGPPWPCPWCLWHSVRPCNPPQRWLDSALVLGFSVTE